MTVLALFSLVLAGCFPGVGNLQSYVDVEDGYEFLYPQGWIEVIVEDASPGVDVVFRDLIEQTENLSLIISDVPPGQTLSELGDPSAVGYRFFQQVKNDPQQKKELEFLRAESLKKDNDTYYILEYQTKLADQQERHNLASVTIKGGRLFTFNLSTPQSRWQKVQQLSDIVVKSFSVS